MGITPIQGMKMNNPSLLQYIKEGLSDRIAAYRADWDIHLALSASAYEGSLKA